MDTNPLYYVAYEGSKDFGPEQLKTSKATGFGAAADDYAERGIDLNEQLIKNKPATFFMRVNGNAMIGAGIHNGDVVIVDRSLTATSGKIVIAVLNGEMLIRRYEVYNKKVRLVPATRKLSAIEVDAYADFSIWGVVTYAIRIL